MIEVSAISGICLVHHLRRSARAASHRLDMALEPFGLQASQFTVLCALAEAQPVTAGQLARRLAMDRSTLNRNLKPISKAGWVEVSGGRGRRGLELTLTGDGFDLLHEALEAWRGVQQSLAEELGSADAGRMLTVLSRIRHAD